jgi:prolipoprotein diacylglyceryltransferase
MELAAIPSPGRGEWHLGPLPVRAFAFCIILGVLVGVWVASRRYARVGGSKGVILDVAAWAVPFGLMGAFLHGLLTEIAPHSAVRTWDGAIGIPGAIALGALGAWIACRRAGVRLAPIAGAAAPGVAFGAAIGGLGNWWGQALYGRPSTWPWALQISPSRRVPGFENYATYQPVFLYESLWDIAVGFGVIWAARRFALRGDRAFALFAALYGIGSFGTEAQRPGSADRVLGMRAGQWVALLALAAAITYLYRTRHERGPDVAARLPGPIITKAPLEGNSSSDVMSM